MRSVICDVEDEWQRIHVDSIEALNLSERRLVSLEHGLFETLAHVGNCKLEGEASPES